MSTNGAPTAAPDAAIPKPVVKIDNIRDPFATVVTVEVCICVSWRRSSGRVAALASVALHTGSAPGCCSWRRAAQTPQSHAAERIPPCRAAGVHGAPAGGQPRCPSMGATRPATCTAWLHGADAWLSSPALPHLPRTRAAPRCAAVWGPPGRAAGHGERAATPVPQLHRWLHSICNLALLAVPSILWALLGLATLPVFVGSSKRAPLTHCCRSRPSRTWA